MVKKASSIGAINSGNTFHFGRNLALHHRYSACQNVIVKYLHNLPPIGENDRLIEKCMQLVDDGELKQCNRGAPIWNNMDTVYSMNKRRRWELPELVQTSISSLRQEIEEESKIEFKPAIRAVMVEREINAIRATHFGQHSLKSDCIAYHDSSLPAEYSTKQVPKKNKYSNYTDLRARCMGEVDVENAGSRTGAVSTRKEMRRLEHRCHRRGVQRLQERQRPTRTLDTFINPNEPVVSNDVPEVRYEVCRPQKLIGHSMFNDIPVSPERCRNEKLIRRKNSKYCGNRLDDPFEWNGYSMNEMRNAYDSEYSMAIDDQEMSDNMEECVYDQESRVSQDYCFTLEEIMGAKYVDNGEKKRKRRKKNDSKENDAVVYSSNTASSNVVKRHAKGSAVYMNRHESTHLINNVSDNTINSSTSGADTMSNSWVMLDDFLGAIDIPVDQNESDEMPLVQLKLTNSAIASITPENLQAEFGDAYEEGKCRPRKFTIDIGMLYAGTSELENYQATCPPKPATLIKDGGSLKINLVFQTGDLSGQLMNIYVQSTLEWKSQAALVSLLTDFLQQNDSVQLRHIIDYVFLFVKHSVKPSITIQDVSEPTFCMLNKLGGWQYEVLSNVDEVHGIISNKMVESEYDNYVVISALDINELSDNISADKSSHCDICYQPIVRAIKDVNVLAGTSLIGCRHHWYCNICWQRHLVARIEHGDLQLTCPAYQCKEIVDKVTLLSLLPWRYYAKYVSDVTEAAIKQSPEWKTCPGWRCLKPVRACLYPNKASPTNANVCVYCHCGNIWCFDCEQNGHWPATCDQNSIYVNLLRTRGDAGSKYSSAGGIRSVRVKRCPNCKHPMEKNGGCNHMACRCGKSFCWHCLRPFDAHSDAFCRAHPSDEKEHELIDTVSIIFREYYYQISVRSRHNRALLERTKIDHLLAAMFGRPKFNIEAGMRGGYKLSFGNKTEQKRLAEICLFLKQAHFLLEFSSVVMLHCTKRLRRRCLLLAISRLDFILQRMHEILLVKRRRDSNSVDEKCDMFMRSAKECVCIIIFNIASVQKELAQRLSLANKVT